MVGGGGRSERGTANGERGAGVVLSQSFDGRRLGDEGVMQQSNELSQSVHTPQTLHEAAAGPRFSTVDFSPLTTGVRQTTTEQNADTQHAGTDAALNADGDVVMNDGSTEHVSQTLPDGGLVASDAGNAQTTGSTLGSTLGATSPGGTTLAGVAVAAGAGLLLWALWQWGRRSRATQTLAHGAGKAGALRSGGASVAVPAVVASPSPAHQQLIAAADRIAKQLEQRAGQLERFIQQADSRIIELKRLSMSPVVQRGAEVATTSASGVASSAKPQRPAAFPRSAAETKPANVPATNPLRAATLAMASASSVAPSANNTTASHSTSMSASLAAQHAEVHALADAGLTPVEIAKRLSKPTGQVELILNLRRVVMVG